MKVDELYFVMCALLGIDDAALDDEYRIDREDNFETRHGP